MCFCFVCTSKKQLSFNLSKCDSFRCWRISKPVEKYRSRRKPLGTDGDMEGVDTRTQKEKRFSGRPSPVDPQGQN